MALNNPLEKEIELEPIPTETAQAIFDILELNYDAKVLNEIHASTVTMLRENLSREFVEHIQQVRK